MGLIKIEPEVPEPPYVYQAYPKTLFNRGKSGEVITEIVPDKQHQDALAKGGWVESPDELPEQELAANAKPEEVNAENDRLRAELNQLKVILAQREQVKEHEAKNKPQEHKPQEHKAVEPPVAPHKK